VWCSGRSRDPALSWLRDRLRPIVKRNFEKPWLARSPATPATQRKVSTGQS
jgi:hypothetical protein